MQNDREKTRFHIRPNRLINGVQQVEFLKNQSFVKTEKGYRLIRWEGKTILIIEEKKIDLPILAVDYVVLSNNSTPLSVIHEKIEFETLIIDSSNSFYFAEKVKIEAALLNIPIHSVLHQGAFIQNL